MSSSFPGPSMPGRASPRALVLWLALLSTLLMSCSAAHEETPVDPEPEITASHVGATVAEDSLRTTSAVGRVVGRLPVPRRQAVRREATTVIDRWWEAAYLSAEIFDNRRARLNRSTAPSVFPGFTPGARVRALGDRELMTNDGLGATSLTPLMRRVQLDLLAINNRARAVTARFDLRFRVAGRSKHPGARRMQVRGRLFLTHAPRGWKIFGYDVSKGWL